MSAPRVDCPLFWDRLERLYSNWRANRDSTDNPNWKADAIIICGGLTTDESRKTNALQLWLFGYEFTETLICFAENVVLILSSPKKVNILEPITGSVDGRSSSVPIKFLTKEKDNLNDLFKEISTTIDSSFSGKSIGILKRENISGPFADAWMSHLTGMRQDHLDVAPAVSELFSVKDQAELKAIKTAALISGHVLRMNLLPAIEKTIDSEKNMTHQQLSKQTEAIFSTPEQISSKLSAELVDSCYTPLVQSGGVYDLRAGAASNQDNLHFGTIIVGLGARYKSYCSNVARTYLVDATKDQEEAYNLLLECHQVVCQNLKPGIPINEIHSAVVSLVQSKNPDLVPKLTKNLGFSMGIEFMESAYVINDKNKKLIQPNMVFNIGIGFQGLELKENPKNDPKKQMYALFVADTVLVTKDQPEIMTEKSPKNFTEISYKLDDKKEEVAPPKKKTKSPQPVRTSPVETETKLRSSTGKARKDEQQKLAAEAKRKEHQKELEEKKRREAQEIYARKQKKGKTTETKEVTVVNSYKDPSQFPVTESVNKIIVDTTHESVLMPIYGMLVPFHISTIKNASKGTDEEYLRINFNTSDNADANNNVVYIKELTYRSSDTKALATALRLIKELRKRVSQRDEKLRLESDIVEQDKLIISKGRNPRLSDIFVRPSPTGRKTTGILEGHTNGFRFTTPKGANVDILYKNIAHAFFQPAENELLVLIHFHLNHAIMIGKKKTQDVQFCTEVMEVSQALDGRYKHGEDELEDEQRERQLRARLNNEFQSFVKRIEEATGLEFDMPYSDLGFSGVPHRSNVLLQPTVNCLVNLTEQPFFVMSLKAVEIAYFERVQFSLKNFDLVFVMKDYSKPVIHINAIGIDFLESIKEWLDSCDIKYYEGTQTLNWNRIMGVIQADPQKFHTEEGGWSFLNPDSDEDEDDGEQSSDFEGGGDSDGYGSESEDEDEFSEASDEDEVEDEDSEEDEGEDWDVLERKAAREDDEKKMTRQKRGRDFDSDEEREEEEREKKRKQSASVKSGGGKMAAGGASKGSGSGSKGSGSKGAGAGARSGKPATSLPLKKRT